ncbi:hypothetical protein EJ02DRAFT_388897 [Clathrospora elynae]|uniref:Uncharacterized protein n=1 Tax=Clathrospora elynae TaxID=706981 RepID=A0A6A5S847_9PLEO|nr:hypothetical protein EJ02DRAFT_388897 [Clathrospora elynae]
MLFKSLTTALFATAALTVSATPTTLSARQGAPRVRATFFNKNSCGANDHQAHWAEDTVFLQNTVLGLPGCQNLDVGPFAATYFNESSISITRTLRFYNLPCAQLSTIESGNHIDIKSTDGPTPGCRTLAIRSAVTL